MMSQDQLGFTLIEVMLACCLGAGLLLFLEVMYIDVYAAKAMQLELSDFIDRERFLSSYVAAQLKSAGNVNCIDVNTPHAIAVRGISADGSVPKWVTGRAVASDVIILTGCVRYKGKQQFLETAYYIGKTTRKDHRGHTLLSLYKKIKGSRREELVSGIVSLNIQYGILDSNSNITFLTASDISDWSAVRYIDVVFLLRSHGYFLRRPYCYWKRNTHYCDTSGLMMKAFPVVAAVRQLPP